MSTRSRKAPATTPTADFATRSALEEVRCSLLAKIDALADKIDTLAIRMPNLDALTTMKARVTGFDHAVKKHKDQLTEVTKKLTTVSAAGANIDAHAIEDSFLKLTNRLEALEQARNSASPCETETLSRAHTNEDEGAGVDDEDREAAQRVKRRQRSQRKKKAVSREVENALRQTIRRVMVRLIDVRSKPTEFSDSQHWPGIPVLGDDLAKNPSKYPPDFGSTLDAEVNRPYLEANQELTAREPANDVIKEEHLTSISLVTQYSRDYFVQLRYKSKTQVSFAAAEASTRHDAKSKNERRR